MPHKPPRPCRVPACPNTTQNRSGFCDDHKHYELIAKREYDRRRPSAHIRGYNYKWQKYRKSFLKANPLCAECITKGQVTAATVVDHITPHRGDQVLFWDTANHQPLCKRCHDQKTALETRGESKGRFTPRPHKGGVLQSLGGLLSKPALVTHTGRRS